MREYFSSLANQKGRWFLIGVALILLVTSFVGGMKVGKFSDSASVPVFSPDPDWFMTTLKKVQPTVYEISKVIEVVDGDTFKADLSRFGRVEEKSVKIRLAGVNSPERFDQNCWKEAKDFTYGWLTGGGKVFVETWGKDTYGNRPVGFVYRQEPFKSLEYDLVRNGFALPCLGYLKSQVSSEKFQNQQKMIMEASALSQKDATKKTDSVWAKAMLPVSLTVVPNTPGKSNANGDSIIIGLNYTSQTIDLTGFSVMDESSQPDHRFYLPHFVLDKNMKSLTIYIGTSKDSGWIASSGNKLFAMSAGDWINDTGDTVYLRDSSRRVVAYINYDSKKKTNN